MHENTHTVLCSGYHLVTKLTASIYMFVSCLSDPNAPKKPANAFLMFCQEKRLSASQSNHSDKPKVEMSHADLTKQLAKEWNDLEENAKKVTIVIIPLLSYHLLRI